MAKQTSSSSGDWTAGIVAIVAAMLLGGAIPIGLYFALYVPRVQARIAEEKRHETLKQDESLLIAKEERVRKLEEDAVGMEARLAKVEEKFTPMVDRAELLKTISDLARDHNIRLKTEMSQTLRAKVVYEGGADIGFSKGLKAASIIVDCQATYHDFGRFLAELESMPNAVLIVDSLEIDSDQNGGYSHKFLLNLYAVERRDVSAVGTK